MRPETVLELAHVSASKGDRVRVEDLSLTVQRGEAVALVGSNASGKSLALKLGAGLETPASGAVRVLGVDPAQASEDEVLRLRQRIGVVFDKPALVSNMSVFNNVALPLRYHLAPPDDEVRDRVMARLAECGVEDVRDRFPVDLTLGDARLAAIARARAMDPDILFIDELLIGLDADDLARVRGLVEGPWREEGLTVVITLNAPTTLFRVFDRLVLLRDGRLVAACPPAEAARVKDPMVPDFFAS
jgi:ABC-type transporter Mla maintaining outer membrane lipid asymmetry ATPase subunit MlaF